MASPFGRALDSVIGVFAPKAQLERTKARLQTAHLMNYDGATRGRRADGIKAPATDGDAAAYGQRPRLRNVSRDMIRNHPYAARARDVVVANVVGTGIVWSVEHEDEKKREQIAEVLKAHLNTPAIDARGECDLWEMQAVVMSAVFSDGEVLARRRVRSNQFGRNLGLGFQIELLEADHLDTTIQSNGANEVIEGVEYSPIGDIEAYWLYRRHPGSASTKQDFVSERVSWRDVLHVRRFDRPGQLRGVPWLAPVILSMSDLSTYQEAQILKQKMAAMVAGVVSYDEADATVAKQAKGEQRGLEDLSPGSLVWAPDGATVTWTNPPRVDGFSDFMAQGLTAMAMGIGLSYEALSGDLSRVNFSSGRMGRMEMDKNIEMWQRNLMIGQFCVGVARWIEEAWRLQSVLPSERFKLDWTAPRRALIDPVREIAALLDAVDGGLLSLSRAQRSLGLDPETIRRERAEDEAAEAKLPAARRTAGIIETDKITGENQ
ncbi:phage portal protein [Pseudotabrizicola algicola]|uniref:Phage portal protein n=1 Tax=Pseudotabrizicola algicola TaxID=2709381 RepID=A0A6B3RIE5_9RHOB|nr:phage portal protein [Pseudotabrizicola algicola]NEX45191.1 phage portal protein [Pseudotabrizicola algicola]